MPTDSEWYLVLLVQAGATECGETGATENGLPHKLVSCSYVIGGSVPITSLEGIIQYARLLNNCTVARVGSTLEPTWLHLDWLMLLCFVLLMLFVGGWLLLLMMLVVAVDVVVVGVQSYKL